MRAALRADHCTEAMWYCFPTGHIQQIHHDASPSNYHLMVPLTMRSENVTMLICDDVSRSPLTQFSRLGCICISVSHSASSARRVCSLWRPLRVGMSCLRTPVHKCVILEMISAHGCKLTRTTMLRNLLDIILSVLGMWKLYQSNERCIQSHSNVCISRHPP